MQWGDPARVAAEIGGDRGGNGGKAGNVGNGGCFAPRDNGTQPSGQGGDNTPWQWQAYHREKNTGVELENKMEDMLKK